MDSGTPSRSAPARQAPARRRPRRARALMSGSAKGVQ
jgi:hypothetical protein